jgi:radical SAM protein with 4Fe4S-binding SPASM domain
MSLPHEPMISGVAIELTNYCQLRCNKCWSQSPQLREPREKGFMTETLFDKVLAETVAIAKHSDRFDRMIVALSYGGESLLHPLFTKFAEKFGKTKFTRKQIVTNGLLLADEKMRQVLIDNFAEIAISIHNVPQLPQVIENTRAFVNQFKGHEPTVFRANIVDEEFKTQYGLQKVKKELEGFGVAVKVMSAITEDMSRFLDDSKFRPELCFVPYWYMGVLWNGDVVPCCHVLSPGRWSLGNVSDRSLQDVFDDEPYKRLRSGFYEGTLCERCTIRA